MFPMIATAGSSPPQANRRYRGRTRPASGSRCPSRQVGRHAGGSLADLAAARAFWREADFVSVGSNDLGSSSCSPATAAIRAWPAAMTRCRRPCWRAGDQWSRHCAAAGRPLSVCGEMASRPIEAMGLAGFGAESPVHGSPRPSARLKPCSTQPRYRAIAGLYGRPRVGLPHASLRRDLISYARDHDVAL